MRKPYRSRRLVKKLLKKAKRRVGDAFILASGRMITGVELKLEGWWDLAKYGPSAD